MGKSMIKLDDRELSRNPKLTSEQKEAIRCLVESVNRGNVADKIKLKKAVKLYGIDGIVREDDIPIEPQEIEGCGYYDGVAPEIESLKWFYDPDNVQWVGFPSEKEYNNCSEEELVKFSRYDLPEWEVYVPLEYQRPIKESIRSIPYTPVQMPVGIQNRQKARFSPRISRNVGMGGMRGK
ncbi:MAG: hypothetical protein WC516_08715 [Patescibacteria group bacterium]|jgi:hypothetical protein